jgi:tetratricopeptide (TPR) repeat protein
VRTFFVAAILAFGVTLPARAGYVDPAASPVAHSTDYLAGREMIQAQDYAQAIEHFTIVLASEPQNADAQYWLGFAQARLGRNDLALDAFRAALRADRAHRAAHAALGEALLRAGDRAGARAQLAALAKLCTDCDEYRALANALAATR